MGVLVHFGQANYGDSDEIEAIREIVGPVFVRKFPTIYRVGTCFAA